MKRLKNLFKDVPNSVIFWNAMYYLILGVVSIIDLDVAFGIYIFSSVIGFLFIVGSVFDGTDDDIKHHLWLVTSFGVIYIAIIGGLAFCVIYPMYKLVNWINRVLDADTCIRHGWKIISKPPKMVDDPDSMCSYNIVLKCDRCYREKTVQSDLHLGSRILLDGEENIGKRVKKTSKDNTEPKPFKSGQKINTIKGVITHPHLNIPAYVFEEDDSYVECRRCIIVE